MSRWLATAPGKVVLLGEYAVLEGSQSLVMAVDRRCRVTLTPCARGACRIEAPQLRMPALRFGLESGRPRWPDALAPDFARTAALIETLLADIVERGGRVEPFQMKIDTGELFIDNGRQPVKLGLGSSAATAVAIDAVLRAAFLPEAPRECPAETVARLLVPGRAAQGNAGSGIDLAASLCGGVQAYRIRDESIDIRPIELPETIATQFVWAGVPASTSDLLAAWGRAREDSPGAAGDVLVDLSGCAAAGVDAAERRDAGALLRHWSEYGRIMGRMNELLDQEVVTVEHRLAAGMAQLIGGAYKPCGAGGGDLGLAASEDEAFPERMRDLCREVGLRTLTLRPARQGVRVTRE
jgi:phosphomevalonate kinase